MGSSASKKAKKRAKKTLKLVTLGTAATGKTTFFRQLKIIHEGGFDEIENQNFVRIFRSNFLLGFKEIMGVIDDWELQVKKKNKNTAQYFREVDVDGDEQIDSGVIENAMALWTDPAVEQVWEQKDSLPKFTITNLDYLVEHIERLSGENAVATDDDIIRCRQRTTGISNFNFKLDKYFVHVVDVGGQKIERRKWESVSEGSAAMLFFASLVDFDVPLPNEDKTRMDDSLEVWKNMISQDIFENSTVILFLNKLDLFEEKIERVDMSETFKDYTGGHNYDEGVEYIKSKYLKVLEEGVVKDENVFVHVTCALDTNMMGTVFDDVMQQIFRQRLAASGLPTFR